MEQEHIDFFFEDSPAGYIESPPTSPGTYRYMPFRGLGHLRFLEALASSGAQRCWFMQNGEKIYFVVSKVDDQKLVVI